MKHFFVYTVLSDELSECLQDSTFIMKSDLLWERTRFDLAYIDEYALDGQYPFGLIITTNKNIKLPADVYDCTVYTAAGREYFLYYIYEQAPQFDASWQQAYGEQQSLKYLVDTVYRYLLREAIAENEEWCGHFSSALRKMQ